MEIITSSWTAQAAYVAAELGIADMLAEGPMLADQLAEATGTHALSLRRLLRAMTTINLVRQLENGSFEVTPLGALLGTDAPNSLRYWTIWWGKHLWPLWGSLLYSVRTGDSARKLLLGTEGFEHLQKDPEAAAIFHRAAAELTRLTAERVVSAYDFSGLKRIVDVGGGCGELLASILRANRTVQGVLFDLPHAIDAAQPRLEEFDLDSRCEFVAGDFFESVPVGGDAYILKSVIHDWNDDRSKLILANCHRALGGAGRLLLVEEMLPDRLENSPAHQAVVCSDLNMLITHAAGERTESDFRLLLRSAGFRLTRIVPVGMTYSVIEAEPEK
jgi:SAM-dependent methyltransferase